MKNILATTKQRVVLSCLVFLLALSGCGSATTPSSSPSQEPSNQPTVAPASSETPEASAATVEQVDMLRFAWANSGYPSPFAFSPSGPGGFLRSSFLFDTLTWKDDTGLIPWLAKSWEISDDSTKYTFKLDAAAQWHDGTAFSAEDVVFSFKYYKQHPFMWTGDLTQIASVAKQDDLTVVFTLNKPYAPFLTDLVGIVPIIPKHIWEKVDQPMTYRDPAALVGTGPFILKEYDEKSGQYLFGANEHFFKGQVKVKEVAYLAVADKILSLKKNEIDGAMTMNYQEAHQMEQEGFGVIKSSPTGSALRITFNLQHPQLGDKRLRQAIAYALDREEMASKITGGDPIVGNAGIIPPDSPWYNTNVKQYGYQVDKAESMLDELGYVKNAAGIREDLKLRVLVSSTSSEAQMMVEMLKKVGIELELQQADAATFTTAMGENNYDMAITGHIGLSGDPDFLRLWFLGQATNTYAARGKAFDSEQYQKLALAQIEEMDAGKRKEMVDQMQDILADELPTLVLYHRPFYFMFNKDLYNEYFNTAGGIADGIPLWDNKAAFIHESK